MKLGVINVNHITAIIGRQYLRFVFCILKVKEIFVFARMEFAAILKFWQSGDH